MAPPPPPPHTQKKNAGPSCMSLLSSKLHAPVLWGSCRPRLPRQTWLPPRPPPLLAHAAPMAQAWLSILVHSASPEESPCGGCGGGQALARATGAMLHALTPATHELLLASAAAADPRCTKHALHAALPPPCRRCPSCWTWCPPRTWARASRARAWATSACTASRIGREVGDLRCDVEARTSPRPTFFSSLGGAPSSLPFTPSSRP